MLFHFLRFMSLVLLPPIPGPFQGSYQRQAAPLGADLLFESPKRRAGSSETRKVADLHDDLLSMNIISLFLSGLFLHAVVEGSFGIEPDAFRILVMRHLFDMAVELAQKRRQRVSVRQKPGSSSSS